MEGRHGPRYLAIADAIGEAISGGEIEAAAKLPTHRDLAYRLGVTVGTVSRAYAEAERRGLVTGEVGRGTFARGGGEALAGPDATLTIPETSPPGMIDLGLNVPAWTVAAPYLGRTLAELARINDLSPLIRYEPDTGRPSHRAAAARWVGSIGLDVPPERIVVTCGAQHGMLIALMALAGPGDVLLTEELTFPGMTALASQLQLRLHGVSVDDEGIDPDAFAAACRATGGKVLYCIPTHQNPTTATMSEERRRAVIAVARRHGVTIIEDDIYGFFPESRPIPMAAMAPEQVFFVTSTAKCMAPGLRIGYGIPPAHLMDRAAANIRMTTWFAPSLGAEIATRWITDGTAGRLLAWQRKELAERHALARRILPEGLAASQPSSLHLWLTLPDPWRGEAFAAELRRRGVIATSAETFAAGRGHLPHAVRLCLCGVAERRQVERGLEIVAETLRDASACCRRII